LTIGTLRKGPDIHLALHTAQRIFKRDLDLRYDVCAAVRSTRSARYPTSEERREQI
jgi:hypothetical protein